MQYSISIKRTANFDITSNIYKLKTLSNSIEQMKSNGTERNEMKRNKTKRNRKTKKKKKRKILCIRNESINLVSKQQQTKQTN